MEERKHKNKSTKKRIVGIIIGCTLIILIAVVIFHLGGENDSPVDGKASVSHKYEINEDVKVGESLHLMFYMVEENGFLKNSDVKIYKRGKDELPVVKYVALSPREKVSESDKYKAYMTFAMNIVFPVTNGEIIDKHITYGFKVVGEKEVADLLSGTTADPYQVMCYPDSHDTNDGDKFIRNYLIDLGTYENKVDRVLGKAFVWTFSEDNTELFKTVDDKKPGYYMYDSYIKLEPTTEDSNYDLIITTNDSDHQEMLNLILDHIKAEMIRDEFDENAWNKIISSDN